jgi:serine protease
MGLFDIRNRIMKVSQIPCSSPYFTGIITAKANSVNGVVGVAPNIKLLIVRVFGDDGDWAYASNLIDAAYRCKDGGANVISMSLGGGGSSLFETNAYADLFTNHNILIVAAAGNDGNTQLSYPASYDSVVSVAAVDFNKDLASFSQRNNQVDIAAPGVDVLSTVPMGTGTTLGSLDVSGGSNIGIPMAGSPNGIASGTLVDCGIGKSDCTDAKGKICLIQRGSFSFARKVLACQNGGGLGAVIYNNGDGVVFSGTLGGTVTTIPSVGISNFDGLYLKANELEGNSATLAVGMSNYEYKSGTSMACPYVSAVAALIWSHDPTKTASQVRVALQSTAEDLGVAGRDNKYGYGLVQAAAACSTLTGSSCTPYDPFEWVTSAINESPSVQPTPFPTSAPTAGDTCSLHRDRCFKNVDCCSRKCKGKKGRRKCKGGKN